MRIKYVGPHTAGVDLAMPDGDYAFVEHGSEIEVDDEHGASLLEQAGNWEAVKATQDKPAKAPKDGES